MSGRAFVGLPLSRDPEWVEATTNYTQDVSRAWMALKMLPWYKRLLMARFLPPVQSLERQKQINVNKLGPLLKVKRAGQVAGKSQRSVDPGGDMIDWFISRYSKPPSVQQLARDQLLATFASVYNLSNALSYIVFDLAGNPDCIDELRQEILDVVGEGAVIDRVALSKLRKLDSFAKESQRLNPPSLGGWCFITNHPPPTTQHRQFRLHSTGQRLTIPIVNIPRVVTNPNGFLTSTGHVVPQGYTVMVRAHPINMSPTLYPPPEVFDPFRFSKLREQPGNENKFQHSSTGVDNINFGHGIWACPGRFFAAAQIKVVMAYLIMNYDMMVKPGEKKPGQVHYGLATLPDAEASILFRKRKKSV
jgi:cytochrome P450